MRQYHDKRPPLILEFILRKISDLERKYSVSGDFEEIYKDISNNSGVIKAQSWYMAQIIKSIPVFFINYLNWSGMMFKNYLKIAFRNLIKQKGFSFINIAGLAVGMACCIFILLWVQDELSYDRFHENADVLFRVT
ncbi:ABC transporter permease, partial [candidate division KSB1 bacterium]